MLLNCIYPSTVLGKRFHKTQYRAGSYANRICFPKTRREILLYFTVNIMNGTLRPEVLAALLWKLSISKSRCESRQGRYSDQAQIRHHVVRRKVKVCI